MLPLNLVSGVWHVSQFHIFVSSVKCMGRFHWSFLPPARLPLPGMRARTRWRRSRAERRRKGVFLYHTNMILSRLSLKSLFRNHPPITASRFATLLLFAEPPFSKYFYFLTGDWDCVYDGALSFWILPPHFLMSRSLLSTTLATLFCSVFLQSTSKRYLH